MRNLFCIIVLLLVFSCSKEELELNQKELNIEAIDSLAIKANGKLYTSEDYLQTKKASIESEISQLRSSFTCTDWSGKIHIKVFYKTFGKTNHPQGTVEVDADYVLVGGGAFTSGWNRDGGFLTESYPDAGLTVWHVKSKDHVRADPHYLYAYAIGMKIDGVSSDYLRSKMIVTQKTSGVANHPNTFITLPSNYLLIGGGAKANWNGAGSLLVHSYPNGNTWYAKSKDHLVVDRSSVTAYAIGIENISFPGVQFIETGSSYNSSYISWGQSLNTTSIPTGWVTTCPGGRTTFNGWGRMLMGIYPNNSNMAQSISKDHSHASNGYSYSYSIRIQKKR